METGLLLANYSKWSDNKSSTGSDNGSSASPLGGSTSSTRGNGQTPPPAELSHALTDRFLTTSPHRDGDDVDFFVRAVDDGEMVGEEVDEGEEQEEDEDAREEEYGIDVREELRTDADEDDLVDAAAAADSGVNLKGGRFEVSNLINSIPSEEADKTAHGINRKSTSLFDGPLELPASTPIVNHPSLWGEMPEAGSSSRNNSNVALSEEGYLGSSRSINSEASGSSGSSSSISWTINNKSAFNEQASSGGAVLGGEGEGPVPAGAALPVPSSASSAMSHNRHEAMIMSTMMTSATAGAGMGAGAAAATTAVRPTVATTLRPCE